MILSVLEMLFPILSLLTIGSFCKRFNIIDEAGLNGLKKIISKICLPVVLFNAFFNAPYDSKTILVFLVVYFGFLVSLGCGFLLKRYVSPYGRFFPFLLTCAEGGMLGYALYGILLGQQTSFAIVDLGQTVFAYTIFLGTLKYVDSKTVSIKALVKNMATNPCFLGMFFGIILGLTNIDTLVHASKFSGILVSVLEMIMLPTGSIVLIIVGYELSLKIDLIVPVLKTVFFRLLVMSILLFLAIYIISSTVGLDREIFFALLILYSLPAPFVIPIFANVGKDAPYISTTVSIHTLFTLLLFTIISIFYYSF